MINAENLLNDFPGLITWSRGPKNGLISNISSPQLANAESVLFISDEKHLSLALKSPATVLVVHKKLLQSIPESEKRTILLSPTPHLCMAKAAKKYFPVTAHRMPVDSHRIHPSAHISKSAELGTGVIVGPGAVIGDHCSIGQDAIIGANAVIEPGVKIGARTHIHPLVFIAHHCEIGMDCEIKSNSTIGGEGFGYAQDEKGEHHRITHYGRLIIEDRVHIGGGTAIDRGTFTDSRIGAGTKIDNYCHLAHNIVIGKNTLVTAGMITAGSATIGSSCVFGGSSIVTGHISIGDNSRFAGLSAVTKTMTEPGQYGGYPIQDLKSALRTTASLPSLPSLRKKVAMIMKRLGIEDTE